MSFIIGGNGDEHYHEYMSNTWKPYAYYGDYRKVKTALLHVVLRKNSYFFPPFFLCLRYECIHTLHFMFDSMDARKHEIELSKSSSFRFMIHNVYVYYWNFMGRVRHSNLISS